MRRRPVDRFLPVSLTAAQVSGQSSDTAVAEVEPGNVGSKGGTVRVRSRRPDARRHRQHRSQQPLPHQEHVHQSAGDVSPVRVLELCPVSGLGKAKDLLHGLMRMPRLLGNHRSAPVTCCLGYAQGRWRLPFSWMNSRAWGATSRIALPWPRQVECCGWDAHGCASPAQIRAWALSRPAPTSGGERQTAGSARGGGWRRAAKGVLVLRPRRCQAKREPWDRRC